MPVATSPSTYTEAPSYAYMPALDGLRAIAILLVLAAHFGLEHLVPGGFGVTLFFFISGFLISRQLSCEVKRNGKIHYVAFYMRRFTRLMPALAVMILVSATIFIAFGGKVTVTETISALLYTANYYDLYVMYDSNVSGLRHPFIILWSLAVEEHFYILFPFFFAVFGHHKKYLMILIFLCAAVLIWRLYLWNVCSGQNCGLRDINRFYKATDTRFDSILYGVLLTAMCVEKNTLWLKNNGVFIASFILLLLTFLIRYEAFRETWRYSLQGLALLSCIASVLFVPGFAQARKILSHPILLLIGRWSYSLYLYHWVGLMIADKFILTGHAYSGIPCALVMTVMLSAASYYGIERPALAWRKKYGSHAC